MHGLGGGRWPALGQPDAPPPTRHCEPFEQGGASCCGEWGGKGAAGGEHRLGAHAPDSEQEYACPSVSMVCVKQIAVWVC